MSDVIPPPPPEPAPVPQAVPQAVPQSASPPPSYGAPAGPALPPKDLALSYILWFFVGVLGIHHFYLGKVGRGLLWLFTFGLLGIGMLVDLFTLPSQVRAVNARRAVGIK